jgi:hypothetical protein
MALQLLNDTQRITVKDSELADVDGGDAETTYTLRQILPDVNAQISKKHTTHQRGTREPNVAHVALMNDLLDYALVAWTGILADGAEAPCVRNNKLLLDVPRKTALLSIAGRNRSADPEEKDA